MHTSPLSAITMIVLLLSSTERKQGQNEGEGLGAEPVVRHVDMNLDP